MAAKRIFVSYSHDSPEHKAWVEGLSTYLTQNGLYVLLDQWDLEYGADLPSFMESVITASDKVLIILTDAYIAKANAGDGGVGYERTIVTAEIFRGVSREKFVPIVRDVTGPQKLPVFLASAKWIDLAGDKDSAEQRMELVRCLHGVAPARPEIGRNPFEGQPIAPVSAGPAKKVNAESSEDSQSLALFDGRFRKAFEGLRDRGWIYRGSDGLLAFMKTPLGPGNRTPIWWWRGRGRSQGILRFEPVVRAPPPSGENPSGEADKILMNNQEFIVDEWAACHMGGPELHFIYVATKPCLPVGDHYSRQLVRGLDGGDYFVEQFGLVNNRDKITKAQFEDRSALDAEDPRKIGINSELRVQFITSYNFLIIPQGSHIRSQDHSGDVVRVMGGMLNKRRELGDLMAAVAALPKANNGP